MGFTEKIGDVLPDLDLDRLPTPRQLSDYVKKVFNSGATIYHETMVMEVTKVITNEPFDRGAVEGIFLHDPQQVTTRIKPQSQGVLRIPVKGEHVTVKELNGQFFYDSILNRRENVNENSLAGVTGILDSDNILSEDGTFTKKRVAPIKISEGCTLFEGRFGHSIHLSRNNPNNDPTIKMRVSSRQDSGQTTESIDNDDSSIYLISNGLEVGNKFDDEVLEGKKVLIKSDGIFISGRQEIRLNSSNVKLGGNDNLEPVVKGDQLVKLLDGIVKALSDGANAFTTEKAAGTTIQTLLALLPDTKSILSEKVKTS